MSVNALSEIKFLRKFRNYGISTALNSVCFLISWIQESGTGKSQVMLDVVNYRFEK